MNVKNIRENFPILKEKVNGKPLVYFDNAATSQKPEDVIESLRTYYHSYNANIHRGVHTLAEQATTAYEDTRIACQHFINAPKKEDIIFTSGVTEGINLISHAYGKKFLQSGDEIIISEMEHHSNIVPWQLLCEEKNLTLSIIPITSQGVIDIVFFQKMLSRKTKIVSICHASNTLGVINPIKEIIASAHEVGAIVVVDGAQAGAHIPIDVQNTDADFYCLSAHKMYGPTGVGILYGKSHWLNEMNPYMGGGEMIKNVSFEKTTYNDVPYKFEAGTPHIAGVIAFHKALSFINTLGKKTIAQHEHKLLQHVTQQMENIPGIRMWGLSPQKVGIVCFNVARCHYFDVGNMLDANGIAVRTGHHCTQPLMNNLGVDGTVRISFAIYNTINEIDYFIQCLQKIIALP